MRTWSHSGAPLDVHLKYTLKRPVAGLGKTAAPGPLLWVSMGAVIAPPAGGLIYFRRTESTFADIL